MATMMIENARKQSSAARSPKTDGTNPPAKSTAQNPVPPAVLDFITRLDEGETPVLGEFALAFWQYRTVGANDPDAQTQFKSLSILRRQEIADELETRAQIAGVELLDPDEAEALSSTAPGPPLAAVRKFPGKSSSLDASSLKENLKGIYSDGRLPSAGRAAARAARKSPPPPPAGLSSEGEIPSEGKASASAGEFAGPSRFQEIEIDKIVPSKTNSRRVFNPEKLQELADSILLTGGVMQPITLRPLPGFEKNPKGPSWEIVTGERRYLASKLAGLKSIPSIIRDLRDLAALEAQIIENAQRENLNPLEEAHGFKQLIDMGKTIEFIASKIKKSHSTIYASLKLLDLPKSVLDALAKGIIPKSTAELVARIPDPKLREKAAKQILPGPGPKDDDEPASFRQAKDLIDREYSRELKRAPFPLELAQLGGKDVPPCPLCPHYAGNLPDFAGSRPDVCTHPPCYDRKIAANLNRQRQLHTQAGGKLLSDADRRKCFQYSGQSQISYNSGFVDLNERCTGDSKNRTWGNLIGDAIKPGLTHDDDGRAHLLVPFKEAMAHVKKEHGIGNGNGSSSNRASGAGDYAATEQAANKKRKSAAAIRKRAAAIMIEMSAAALGDKGRVDGEMIARSIALLAADCAPTEILANITGHSSKIAAGVAGHFKKHILTSNARDAAAAAIKILLFTSLDGRYTGEWNSGKIPDEAANAMDILKIDYKKIEKETAAELKKKSKLPAKPDAKKRAKSKEKP